MTGPTPGSLQDLVLLSPQGAFANQLVKIPVDGIQALAEDRDKLLDVGPDPLGRGDQAVSLDRDHLDDLAPAVVEGLELLELQGFQGPHLGFDGLGEPGQDAGIDGIGLGQLSGGLGEVADLSGIDDHQGQTLCGKVAHSIHLPASRGLEEHQGGGQRVEEVG